LEERNDHVLRLQVVKVSDGNFGVVNHRCCGEKHLVL
jgi:hypothetical protein